MRVQNKILIAACVCLINIQAFAQPDPTTNLPQSGIAQGPPVTVYPNLQNLTNTGLNNFVRAYAPQEPFPYSNFVTLTSGGSIINTAYFDGLGRPMQEVQKTAIPGSSHNDIITVHAYDEIGRESNTYLPFSVSDVANQGGKLNATPLTQLSAQYNTLYPGDQPYNQTVYDNSPLNRVVQVMAPGNSWVGSGNGVSYLYNTNAAANGDQVVMWTITGGNTDEPVANGYYPDGSLYVTQTTDEDGNQSYEYNDMLGRVVLKTQFVADEWIYSDINAIMYDNYAQTYYVYDDLNHLRWVITPEAVNQGIVSASGSTLDGLLWGLCYNYAYDGRGRTIEKQLPGKGREYFVYDERDRLIFSQDGNLRGCTLTNNSGIPTEIGSSCRWQYTYYDVLDRPLMTGLYTNGNISRKDLQATVDAGPTTDGSSLMYYITNDQFNNYLPYFSDATIWTINYYDDYSNPAISGSSFNSSYNGLLTGLYPYASPPQSVTQTRGLQTGSQTIVLDPNEVLGTNYLLPDTRMLTRANFYDDKERLIQTQSNNHCGGTDILTNEYNFAGAVVSSELHDNNPLAISPDPVNNPGMLQNTDIVTTYNFDNTNGKPIGETQHIIGAACGTMAINTITYDALGRVGNKELNVANNNYTYNIRNWLTGINSTYFNTALTGIFFKERLSYDQGFTNSLLNGNIAGIEWQQSGHYAPLQAYGYSYDNLNRVTYAQYNEEQNLFAGGGFTSWNHNNDDYTMSNVAYDNNGNIQSMQQMGPNTAGGAPVQIDNLTYQYPPASNQLQGVSDAGVITTNPDFKDDANNSTNDYTYDPNGNLAIDNNKGITTPISYSYLNKPEHIIINNTGGTIYNKGTVDYIYDANGNKLQKIVTDMVAGTTTTTDYVGPFEYKNHTLQFIGNAEGRCRPEYTSAGLNYIYDYFLKDHLGNVRTVVTANESSAGNNATARYLATHEIAAANTEEAVFNNIELVRTDKPGDTDPDDTKAATLIGNDPQRCIGTSIMLRVMPGDQFSASANSYYGASDNSDGANTSTVLGALLNTLAGGANYAGVPVKDIPANIQILKNTFGNPNFDNVYNGLVKNSFDPTLPASFLNYVVMDEKSNIMADQSGVIQISGVPEQWNPVGTAGNIQVMQPGYVLIFISSADQQPISWDQVDIMHYKGNVTEEDHYYPFGLTLETSNNDPNEVNNIKYNSKELQHNEFTDVSGNKSGLELYDYGARMQDPQLGRWLQIDPLAEKCSWQSPYCTMDNNPVLKNDPTGMFSQFGAWWRNIAWGGNGTDYSKSKGEWGVRYNYKNENQEQTASFITHGAKPMSYDDMITTYKERLNNQEFVSGIARASGITAPAGENDITLSSYRAQKNLINFGIAFMLDGVTAGTSKVSITQEMQYTKSNLKLGQEMHKAYKVGLEDGINTFKEFREIKGIRPDFVDFNTNTIFELKPFNPRAMEQGVNQLDKYKSLFEKEYGGTWNTILDTY